MPNTADRNIINTSNAKAVNLATGKVEKSVWEKILDFPSSVIRAPFKAISSFFKTYERPIAIAAWIALAIMTAFVIAGVVMASTFPGTWAAVAGFSVLGYSLAGLAGTNLIAQVAVGAALVFAAADVVLGSMFVVGAAIQNWCWPSVDQTKVVTKKTNPFDDMLEGSYNHMPQKKATSKKANVSEPTDQNAYSNPLATDTAKKLADNQPQSSVEFTNSI